MKDIWNKVLDYLPTLGMAILILVGGFVLIRLLVALTKKILKKTKVDPAIHHLITTILRILLWVLLVIVVVSHLGLDIAPLITALGAVGLAVSLAVKDNLASLVGGIIIVMAKPFSAGDVVEVCGQTGVVDSIELMYTLLHTADNKRVYVPNNEMSQAVIVNHSSEPTRRVDLDFSVSYGDDPRRAMAILEQMAREDERILPDPAAQVRMKAHGPSSVDLTLKAWVKTEDYWDVYYDFLAKGKEVLEKEGMVIPFPQVQIHHTNN